MTPEPEESVYSSVATLRSLRIVIFLAELNGLQLMQGDIGNAYLDSYTQDNVYFTAGPEFRHLAGHNYIIDKALYGLRSSGLRFHERLSTVLRQFGFHRSKVDPDVWMRDLNDMWELIVVYVDDIIAAMNDPQSFFDELQGPNVGFTMKGVGSPTYHLGVDFFRDDDGMLCMGAQTYANQLCAAFESLYGEQPKTVFSPLDHEDHPELDDTPLCSPDDIRRILGLTTFNSILQYVNWLVGRFVLSTIVNQNKEAWLQESKLAKMLWTSRREFGTNRWKFLSKANTKSKTLYILDYVKIVSL